MSQKNDIYRRSVFGLVDNPDQWHQALMALPNPHPLQSWPWAQLKKNWGWSASPLRLDVHNDDLERPPLVAALVLKRKLPNFPFSILYVPKGPLLDYNDGALRRVAIAQLEQIARREKVIFIKIDPDVTLAWGTGKDRISPTGSKFARELQERGWRFSDDQVQFRNTVELDLQRSEDDLLAAMKQKTRYNIRLAGRKGIDVRRGTDQDFSMLVDMYMLTAARDNFTVRPPDYYLDAWNKFYKAGMIQSFIAEYDGNPVAAVLIVRYGKRAIYMYGASTELERKRMPNYLLQWEAIRWAKQVGCDTYDFWGAPNVFEEDDPLWGVWRFKVGFNGQVVRHIGAWDYPSRPFWYWVYTVVRPKYLSFLRSRKG